MNLLRLIKRSSTDTTVSGEADDSNNLYVNVAGATPVADTLTKYIETVDAHGVPQVLSATSRTFTSATFIGKNDTAGTDNTGVVYLGIDATTQPIEIVSGAVWSITAPQGVKLDLADFYIDSDTDDDGVIVLYV